MTGPKRFLQSIARIAALGLMALVLIFVIREGVVRSLTPQPNTESQGPNPISGFVNCINLQRAPANPTRALGSSPLSNIRAVNQSREFGVISGGLDREGRWIAIVDFRHDPPQVFDARALADPAERSLPRSIASFQVTEAFRACGAEYLGPVPVPPSEWAVWFEDSFFEVYGQ